MYMYGDDTEIASITSKLGVGVGVRGLASMVEGLGFMDGRGPGAGKEPIQFAYSIKYTRKKSANYIRWWNRPVCTARSLWHVRSTNEKQVKRVCRVKGCLNRTIEFICFT